MAKISTYPSAETPLLLSDRLIGTEAIREIPSPTPLATKNFSLGELLNLFSVNFPAASLQAVLDTNNTATQDIYLTGRIESDVIKPFNIEDPTGSQGNTFQYLSKGTLGINWVDLPVDGLQDVLNKQNTATQNITLIGNITSTYITPNNIKDELLNTGNIGQVLTKSSTGIQWKNSSVPTAPSLADVLFTGNTATNDIILTGSFIKNGGTSSQFLKADGSIDSSAYALASSIPTATSDLTNDGEDGINPFITAADVPAQVNADWNATSGVAEILNKPTIPSVTGYVPYTGATQNVNLGEYELKAGQLSLDTTPTGTAAVGTTQWNDTIGSSQTTLKGGSVVLKNGVDLVARVVNKVTPNTTLTKAAYQAVRVSGAQGQRLAVEFAQANNDNNSADTIGLVTETIATNQEGFIMTVGNLEEINTTGSLQGETWADGDVLYLSPTTPGALTNIKPTGLTGHIVVMGYVEYSHAIHGKIYVKIMNGWELDELHNVYINGPTTWQVLRYNGTTNLWVNDSLSASILPSGIDAAKIGAGTVDNTEFGYLNGVTSSIQTQIDGKVPTTRSLTINGTTYDLSADRTWTIATGLTVGTTPITSGTVGRVLFEGTGNVLQESANITWNNTTGAFNVIGLVNAKSTATQTSSLIVEGTTGVNSGNAGFALRTGTGYQPIFFAADSLSGQGVAGFGIFTGGTTPFGIQTGAPNSAFFIHSNGNIGIGTNYTNAGYKLDVNGTARFSQTTTVSADLRCNVIGPIQNQNLTIQATWADSTQVLIQTITNKAQVLIVKPENNLTLAASTHDTQRITHTFAPTSGTGVVNALTLQQTINQTGGANGITRGLYVNPTLTAAADFRAIETTAGNVLFGASGTGFYWNNTNNRLGIGTATPVVRLEVGGDVRIVGSGSTSATTVFGIYNINYQELLRVRNDGLFIFNTPSNILIGTTTDGGYKLDVNGTGRVSGIFVASDRLTVGGTTIIANASVQVNGTNKFVNFNAAYLNGSFYTYQCFGGYEVFGTDSALTGLLTIGGYRASQWTGITFHSDGSERMRIATGGNVLIGTTTNAGYKLDVSGTARVTSSFRCEGQSTFTSAIIATAQVRIGTNPVAASSVLDVQSTTQGFLPPRMTTTQKNAIASPATGLVVYDTTLNKLCVYTTAWETITSA